MNLLFRTVVFPSNKFIGLAYLQFIDDRSCLFIADDAGKAKLNFVKIAMVLLHCHPKAEGKRIFSEDHFLPVCFLL